MGRGAGKGGAGRAPPPPASGRGGATRHDVHGPPGRQARQAARRAQAPPRVSPRGLPRRGPRPAPGAAVRAVTRRLPPRCRGDARPLPPVARGSPAAAVGGGRGRRKEPPPVAQAGPCSPGGSPGPGRGGGWRAAGGVRARWGPRRLWGAGVGAGSAAAAAALCEAGGRAERFFRACGLCVDRKATLNAPCACAGGVRGVFPRPSRCWRGAAGSASRRAAFVQNWSAKPCCQQGACWRREINGGGKANVGCSRKRGSVGGRGVQHSARQLCFFFFNPLKRVDRGANGTLLDALWAWGERVKILFRGGGEGNKSKNWMVPGIPQWTEELPFTYLYSEREGRESKCITGRENKASCIRESRAVEEMQKAGQMTECGGLGVGKASNVVISGNWLEKKIWMGGFFFFPF